LQAAAGGASWAAISRRGSALPDTLPNPVGYSVISWPRRAFGEAFQTISDLGYQGVQLLPWVQDAYPGAKARELKEQLTMLKLFPAALSCRGVSPRPDSSETFTAALREDADFLHGLGGRVLQVVDDGKFDGKYTADQIKSMGARMNELGKIAKDSGLTLGYHPHSRRLGETRAGLASVLDATDPRYVGLIADVAHLQFGGCDPAEVIRTYRQRLVMLHIKDLRKDAYDLARQNRPAANALKHYFCEIGQGVVDFPSVITTLRQIAFEGWLIVELDAYVVPPGGPAESARINKAALQKLGFRIG
jgi:inosose dehydratase